MTVDRAVAVPPQSALQTALAGLIGNVLEWFDFAVYGYFASDIGHQFFPRSSPGAQQLLAFAVFALGFFARPFGSLVLGVVGDRIGRRALLTLVNRVDGRRRLCSSGSCRPTTRSAWPPRSCS